MMPERVDVPPEVDATVACETSGPSAAFYSAFFRQKSFLSADPTASYARADYLASQGFTTRMPIDGAVVLELGAGAGRLTAGLASLGIIDRAKQYVVVEPSAGIELIARRFPPDRTFS